MTRLPSVRKWKTLASVNLLTYIENSVLSRPSFDVQLKGGDAIACSVNSGLWPHLTSEPDSILPFSQFQVGFAKWTTGYEDRTVYCLTRIYMWKNSESISCYKNINDMFSKCNIKLHPPQWVLTLLSLLFGNSRKYLSVPMLWHFRAFPVSTFSGNRPLTEKPLLLQPLPPCHTGKLGTNTLMALVLNPAYLDCSFNKATRTRFKYS